MAEFPVGPMLSKMLLAAEKYVCIIMCIHVGTIIIDQIHYACSPGIAVLKKYSLLQPCSQSTIQFSTDLR